MTRGRTVLLTALLITTSIVAVPVIVIGFSMAKHRVAPTPDALLGTQACEVPLVARVRGGYEECAERGIRHQMRGGDIVDAVRSIDAHGVDRDSRFGTICHMMMHRWGEEYHRRIDVSDVSELRSNCTTGFIHGLVIADVRSGTDVQPGMVERVCRTGTWASVWACQHGFGHAFVQIEDGELAPAIASCEELPHHTALTCASGAMMENEFASEGLRGTRPPSHPTADSRRRLCDSLTDADVRATCASWVFTRDSSIETVATYCADLGSQIDGPCWRRVGSFSPPSRQRELCGLEKECWSGVGIGTGRCGSAPDNTTRAACSTGLGIWYAQRQDHGDERSPDGCRRLERPDDERRCAAGAATAPHHAVDF